MRNRGWRLLNDLKKSNQIYSFAQTLIKETKEPFWSDSARIVFTTICEICLNLGEISNKSLFKYLILTLPEMYNFLLKAINDIDSVRLACQNLGGPDTKQGKSILSTLSTAIKDFKFLNDGEFSFRNWVKDASENNWLFIENGPQQESLSGLYSGVIDIIASEILSLPDSSNIRHKIEEKFYKNIMPENEIFIEKSELEIEENQLLKHKISLNNITQNQLSDD